MPPKFGRHSAFDLVLLFLWDHDPQYQVDQQTGNTTGCKRKKYSYAEPPGTDPKEFSQTTTDTCDDAVRT
jgi:hypothetical protein